MNYRSFADLNKCLIQNLHRIPHDIELIVGIPRSGLLVANMLALYLNLPLADLEGFLAGRVLLPGRTRRREGMHLSADAYRKVLVIDDSARSGETLSQVRKEVEFAKLTKEILFGAVYVTWASAHLVDIYFEVCPLPRVFEWNLMHHRQLKHFCLDIDGVLCRDPTPDENDDGRRYARFLDTAEPLLLPSKEVGTLVTCRLEKYRRKTEEWLERYGVKFKRLTMMDLPNKAARVASGSHSAFKAKEYRETHAALFIESSFAQAKAIAAQSGKPVLCIETQRLVSPPWHAVVRRWAQEILERIHRRFRSEVSRASRIHR